MAKTTEARLTPLELGIQTPSALSTADLSNEISSKNIIIPSQSDNTYVSTTEISLSTAKSLYPPATSASQTSLPISQSEASPHDSFVSDRHSIVVTISHDGAALQYTAMLISTDVTILRLAGSTPSTIQTDNTHEPSLPSYAASTALS
jgi:hypothetical protein